jgi:hypothetical protein
VDEKIWLQAMWLETTYTRLQRLVFEMCKQGQVSSEFVVVKPGAGFGSPFFLREEINLELPEKLTDDHRRKIKGIKARMDQIGEKVGKPWADMSPCELQELTQLQEELQTILGQYELETEGSDGKRNDS